jgi:outer membrane protein assembly factor BamB
MPAYKYSHDLDTGEGSVSVETGFDSQQFGDLELLGTLMQFKEMKQSFWEQIGVGGSIVSRGRAHDGKLYFGCCDKNFYCVDVKKGKEIWRFPTNGLIHDESGPAFMMGMVYFCCADGNLYAVNADTGLLVWKYQTDGPLYGDPWVDGDRVYFCSKDGSIYSVNAEDGNLVWKLNVNANTLFPCVHNGRLYAGWRNSTLFCISLEGEVIWKFFARDDVASWPPAFSEKGIYIGSWDSNLYCIDYDGKLTWKSGAGEDTTYPPIIHENRIYFGSRDYCVYCLNATNGTLNWKFKTNGFVVNVAYNDGRVFFGSYDNNVYCVDAETGKLIWKSPTNGFVNAVTVSDGRIFAGSWDCNMYCLDIETGKPIWKFKTSIGAPSQIAQPETSMSKTAEITWTPETEEEKKKYQGDASSGDYDLNMSQYGAIDKGYTGSKKKGYIK